MDVGDFRPINLLNEVYKIMVKCLKEWFKPLMSAVIGLHQKAFIHDSKFLVVFWWFMNVLNLGCIKVYLGWCRNWILRRSMIVSIGIVLTR